MPPLLNARLGGYPAFVATELAVHRGNLGLADWAIVQFASASGRRACLGARADDETVVKCLSESEL
jgi:hypothetical protein